MQIRDVGGETKAAEEVEEEEFGEEEGGGPAEADSGRERTSARSAVSEDC